MYDFIKIHQNICSRLVYFIAYKLYLVIDRIVSLNKRKNTLKMQLPVVPIETYINMGSMHMQLGMMRSC